MIKAILPLFFFIKIFSFAYSQTYFENIPLELFNKANTAANVDYLSQNEKNVILIMNIARLDGPFFVKHFLNYESFPHPTANVKSLQADLKRIKDLPALAPDSGLHKASESHAKDMGENGLTGHISSDGTETFVRIRKYANGGYMAENCSYGYSDPLEIVLQLLVDEDIPSLGHRKNILTRKFIFVGVSIQPHSEYGWNCVQDFSDTGN